MSGTKTRKRKDLRTNDAEKATITIVTAGQTLAGRYRLEREVARGAMGIVFEAYDEELNDRKVAIKVLPPEMASNENAIKRFKGEAVAAIDLTHNNIVRLYSFDVDNNQAFLVMELLEGKSLEDRIVDDGPLPLADAIEVAKQAAAGLDEAHLAKVVHRDIKPANLLYKDAERKVLKVADFGIACHVRDTMTRLTGQEASGTLLYVAPEQLRGKRPTPQADQYSLAATVYEALSGHPVFSGIGLSVQIMEGTPEPIEGVPDTVNAALARALSKVPEERFETCSAFAEALAAAPAEVEEPAEVAVEPAPPTAAPEEKEPVEEKVEEEQIAEIETSEAPETQEVAPATIGAKAPLGFIGATLIIVAIFALFFAAPGDWFVTDQGECMNNLAKLGSAIAQYQMDHDDKFPKSLQELVIEGYIQDEKILRCPKTNQLYEYNYLMLEKMIDKGHDHLLVIASDGGDYPHSGATNALFGDYRVEAVDRNRAQALGRETSKMLLNESFSPIK